MRTLRDMHAAASPSEPVSYAEPSFMAISEGRPFEFAFRPWVAEWESWSAYRADVRAAFDAALRTYWAALIEKAENEGLKKAPRKHAPRQTRNPELHFEWLVRFQVLGWTHQQIAQHYERTFDTTKRYSSTVNRALRKTANLIGLTLREY
jgi:hypothetical protein